jgi:hypothetical protein
MQMGTPLRAGCLALFVLILGPVAVSAQTIAGVITDASGAFLPGVTVEVSSSALIEKVKSTVSDGEGRYQIIDLRPSNDYKITYSLAGFTTVVREDITLTSNFTAQIDVQLRVGAIEETLTVTGQSPVVDVRGSERRDVVSAQAVDDLPTGRTLPSIARMLPAMTVTAGGANGVVDLGGTASLFIGGMRAYGSVGEAVMMDGMNISGGRGDGAQLINHPSHANVQEYVYQLNGTSAEFQTGNVQINLIPMTGGNRFSGSSSFFYANSSMQWDNASAAQLAAGLAAPPGIDRVYDHNAALGGPIVRDRLWFHFAAGMWGVDNKIAMVHDGKMGPVGQPVIALNQQRAFPLRLTAQLTPRNKLTAFYERNSRDVPFDGVEALNTRPEASSRNYGKLSYITQAKWTSTVTTNFLVEAGWSANFKGLITDYQEVVRTPAQLPPYGDVAKQDTVLNLFYNAATNVTYSPFWRHAEMASMTYLKGAHTFKTGLSFTQAEYNTFTTSNGDIVQIYRSGVPFSVRVLPTPSNATMLADIDLGLYLQDTWTHKRLTLKPGIRFDKLVGSQPEQTAPAGRFLPARTFAAVHDLPNYSDAALRFGAAYDLFGNAKTALKGSVGKYVAAESQTPQEIYNPMYSIRKTVGNIGDVRNWTDLNGDDIAQDNEIGPSTNPGFGTQRTNTLDPTARRGYDILYNVGVDHELRPGFGVGISYNRRDNKRLRFTNNRAYAPTDYQMLTVPDPRGSGEALPVWQVIPGRVRTSDNFDTTSSDNWRTYNGFDVVFNGRLSRGVYFQAGTSTGRITSSSCEIGGSDPNLLRFCDQSDMPFQTTLKGSVNYPLPWLGLGVAAVVQSLPGAERTVVYNVTRAQLPQLSTVSQVNVRLNEPGSLYFERVNELDLSLVSNIRVRGVRLRPQINLFNALNVNEVTAENNVFPRDGQPRAIIGGRLLRLGLIIDY